MCRNKIFVALGTKHWACKCHIGPKLQSYVLCFTYLLLLFEMIFSIQAALRLACSQG